MNHEVGYFDPLLWAVRVMICVATFCIGDKCSVVLCLKNRKYGGVSSLRHRIINLGLNQDTLQHSVHLLSMKLFSTT